MNATPKTIEATSTGLPISRIFGTHLIQVARQSSRSPAAAHRQRHPDMTDHGPANAQASHPAVITLDRMQATLSAFNASNLASSYIERGNFAAAHRKLLLALQAINAIQTEA